MKKSKKAQAIGDGGDDDVVIDDDGSGGPLETKGQAATLGNVEITRKGNHPADGLSNGNSQFDKGAVIDSATICTDGVGQPKVTSVLSCVVVASGQSAGDPPGVILIQDVGNGVQTISTTTMQETDTNPAVAATYAANQMGQIQFIILTAQDGPHSYGPGRKLKVTLGVNYHTNQAGSVPHAAKPSRRSSRE